MGLGSINEALARAAGFRQGRAPVTAKAGDWLRTRYADDEVEAMAQEDGEVGLLGRAGDSGNRVLHGEQAVRESTVTGALGVRNYLDGGRLGKIRRIHACKLQAFWSSKAVARKALGAVIKENARLEGLRSRLADEGLDPPVPRWTETAFLGVLGIGDLTMTSVSFMVLNISDQPFVSWLPFSALTVAALPVVGGMLGAAHFLGESIRARRHEPGLRQVIICAASLGGGLCLAVAIAAIRSAFLTANGVKTLSLPFIGIQVGLFAVATAASAWAAHPFQAQWKAAARAVRRADRGYRTARRRAGKLAGIVNGLTARELTVVSQAASGAWAVLSDGARQRCLYRRWYALGSSPEPVAEDLWMQPADPDLPREALDLVDYPDHTRRGSNLEPLESVSLDDLDAASEKLQQQLQDEADAARRACQERGPAPGNTSSAYALNGSSMQARVQRRARRPRNRRIMNGPRDFRLRGVDLAVGGAHPSRRRAAATWLERERQARPVRLPSLAGAPRNVIRQRVANLDAIFAIDDSTSVHGLGGTDPTGARNAACLSVIDLMQRHGGGRAGLVHWGTTAPASLALAPMPVARRQLQRGLRLQPVLGGTQPAVALARVRKLTEGIGSGRALAVLLLTDGQDLGAGLEQALRQLPARSVHLIVVDPSGDCWGQEAVWRELPWGSFTRLENVGDRRRLAWESGAVIADSIGLRLPGGYWPRQARSPGEHHP